MAEDDSDMMRYGFDGDTESSYVFGHHHTAFVDGRLKNAHIGLATQVAPLGDDGNRVNASSG